MASQELRRTNSRSTVSDEDREAFLSQDFGAGDDEDTDSTEHATLERSKSDLQYLGDLADLVSEHLEAVLFADPSKPGKSSWVDRQKSKHALVWLAKKLRRNKVVTSRLADFYVQFQKRGGDPVRDGSKSLRQSFRESKQFKGSRDFGSQGSQGDFKEPRPSVISRSKDTIETDGTKVTDQSSQSKNSSLTFSLSSTATAVREETLPHNVAEEEHEQTFEVTMVRKSNEFHLLSTQKQYTSGSTSASSKRNRSSRFSSTADAATQTTHTHAMPPKPPAPFAHESLQQPEASKPTQQKSRRPKVRLSTHHRVLPDFQETPSITVKHLLLDSMIRMNPRGKGCCFYHVGLQVLVNCVKEMATHQCNRSVMPHKGWQCSTCFLMEEEYDLNDEPLSVCLLCCCEREGPVEGAPSVEASTWHSGSSDTTTEEVWM